MRFLKLVVLSALLLSACVPVGGTYGSYGAQTTTTTVAARGAVYINGVQLTAAQRAEFEALIGEPVPAERYWVTENGMMGIEGRPGSVDLGAHLRARFGNRGGDGGGGRGGTTEAHSSDGKNHLVSQNGCTILSTPSGSMSVGC